MYSVRWLRWVQINKNNNYANILHQICSPTSQTAPVHYTLIWRWWLWTPIRREWDTQGLLYNAWILGTWLVLSAGHHVWRWAGRATGWPWWRSGSWSRWTGGSPGRSRRRRLRCRPSRHSRSCRQSLYYGELQSIYPNAANLVPSRENE